MKTKKHGLLYTVFRLEDGRLLDLSPMKDSKRPVVRDGNQWITFHGTVGQMDAADPLFLSDLLALPPGTLPSRHGLVCVDSLFKAPDGTLFDISPVRDGEPPRKRVGDRWVPFTLPEDWIENSDVLTPDEQAALPEDLLEDE
jgi:hypothetical protein